MNNKFVKKDNESKRFTFRGYVNIDDVFDLDNGFVEYTDFKSEVYPVKSKTNKEGETQYSANTGLGHVMSGKDFDDTCDYVMKLTSKASVEIEEGYIAKSPLNIDAKEEPKVCKRCDYKDLCARSRVYARGVKDISQDEFEDLIICESKEILPTDDVLCKEDKILPKEEI